MKRTRFCDAFRGHEDAPLFRIASSILWFWFFFPMQPHVPPPHLKLVQEKMRTAAYLP
jgi:hypothetical protein